MRQRVRYQQPDRRRAPRFRISIPPHFRLVKSSEPECVAETLDVSSTGMCMETNCAFRNSVQPTSLRTNCDLAFVALPPISTIAQGPSSDLMREKASGNFAALNKKALAGDTRSQLRLGIAFEFGQG